MGIGCVDSVFDENGRLVLKPGTKIVLLQEKVCAQERVLALGGIPVHDPEASLTMDRIEEGDKERFGE